MINISYTYHTNALQLDVLFWRYMYVWLYIWWTTSKYCVAHYIMYTVPCLSLVVLH